MEKEEINIFRCHWCDKERIDIEIGKYDDAGNWSCVKCFVEHNAK